MRKIQEMEAKRQEEVRAKQYMSDQEKNVRDAKKIEREKRMEEINKEIFEKQKEDEQKRFEKQERLQRERDMEIMRKEAERKAKAETLSRKVNEIDNRRLQETNERRKVIEEKAAKIKQVGFYSSSGLYDTVVDARATS